MRGKEKYINNTAKRNHIPIISEYKWAVTNANTN